MSRRKPMFLRRTKEMKKLAIIHELRELGKRSTLELGFGIGAGASWIAERLGYASAVTVREVLYELVDEKKLIMVVGHKKGIVDGACSFFHADYPPAVAKELL